MEYCTQYFNGALINVHSLGRKAVTLERKSQMICGMKSVK